jgi:hypothetical protein
VDRHELGDPLKWKTVPSGPTEVLHYPDSAFDLRYVLVGSSQVDHMFAWNKLNQGLEGREFAIGVHRRDMETTLDIVLIHLLESLEYLRYSSVHEVVDSYERYLVTTHQEERNLVHEEDVSCQNTSLWSFNNSLGNFT